MFHLLILRSSLRRKIIFSITRGKRNFRKNMPAMFALMGWNTSVFHNTKYCTKFICYSIYLLFNFFVSHSAKYRLFDPVRCPTIRKPLLLQSFTLTIVTMYEQPSSLSALQLPLRGNRFSIRVTIPFKRPQFSHSQF